MKSNQIFFLIAMMLSAFLLNVDYTSVNVALVSIGHDLDVSLNFTRWMLSGYMLIWAAVVVPLGKLQERYGARSFFNIGIFLFLLGSVITALAMNIEFVLLGRVVQGVGAAMYCPALYALLHRQMPKKKVGMAMGLVSMGVGLGMAAGPTLGGVILHYLGWRWIFYINVPFCLFSMLVAFAFVNKDVFKPKEKLDWMSSVLLSFGLIGLLYAFGQVQKSINDYRVIYILIFSVVFLLLFIYRQAKSSNPLVTLTLFKRRNYVIVLVMIFVEQYAFSASMLAISLYFQVGLFKSPLYTGLLFLALNVIFAIVSFFGGKLVDKIGMKKPAVIGLALLGISLMLFAHFNNTQTLFITLFLLGFIGLGMGLAFSSINTGVVLEVDPKMIGVGMSVFMLIALLGNVIAVLATIEIYSHIGVSRLKYLLHGAADVDQLRHMMLHVGNMKHAHFYLPGIGYDKLSHFISVATRAGVCVAIFIAGLLQIVGVVACLMLL